MRKHQINIRCIYSVSHQVMNVGENGTKTHYDPTFDKTYVYGSAANIKHNVKEVFKEISGIKSPVVNFEKVFDIKNLKEDNTVGEKQGGVATQIDLSNPFCALFGAWNATAETYGEKYAKAAIMSAIQVSEFKPIHPLLSSITSIKSKVLGVHVGDENSKLSVVSTGKDGKTHKFNSANELFEGVDIPNVTLEMAKDFFNNTRKMNVYEENTDTNGLFQVDFCINIDDIGRYNLTDNPNIVTEEEKQKLIESGMILKTINNKEYLYFPADFIKKYFKDLVYAIFNWEFTSNVSLHGSKPELLRVAITDKNVHLWQQSTFAKLVNDADKKAELCFNDGLEDKGVYTYNTLLLNKYMQETNTSITALDDAMEKIIEIGNSYIDEQ